MLHAKELVFVMQPLGQYDLAQYDRVGIAGVGHLVAIEVIAGFHDPVDLNRIPGIGHGIAVGLLRMQHILILRRGDRHSQQQGQGNNT